MSAGRSCGRDDLFDACCWPCEPNVLSHSCRKKDCFLVDNCELASKVCHLVVPKVHIIKSDCSTCRIEEPKQEAGYCGLAGPSGTYYSETVARLNLECDIVEDFSFLGIFEGHVRE